MDKLQIAIVTGGASGLGLAISHLLSQNGISVVIFDKNQKAIEATGRLFEAYCVDITQFEQTQKAVEDVFEKHGQIDILVNNAGIIFSQPLINMLNSKEPIHSFDKFQQVINVNLSGVFLMGSLVAQKMIFKRTAGVIVNISSICSQGNAGQSAYSAAKAGVDALTKTWAKELGRFGIRSASVSPGFIETESTKAALSESLINVLKEKIALRKLGTPESVAKLVLSVIENEYINGSILTVDGGCSL